jgi:hypothetical protein
MAIRARPPSHTRIIAVMNIWLTRTIAARTVQDHALQTTLCAHAISPYFEQ